MERPQVAPTCLGYSNIRELRLRWSLLVHRPAVNGHLGHGIVEERSEASHWQVPLGLASQLGSISMTPFPICARMSSE
ncbi:hypothetical protein HII31_01640 [Pseudocercospora fuligena]|uniref:Uncharacterized protein n=1 Tax=Pseudocercospora fuligena TaxID=685502 RepID=A0A8H6VMG6_9PEZI|nr:hypothetical protein HII31_01640 [Pseudocercospora fuligena]